MLLLQFQDLPGCLCLLCWSHASSRSLSGRGLAIYLQTENSRDLVGFVGIGSWSHHRRGTSNPGDFILVRVLSLNLFQKMFRFIRGQAIWVHSIRTTRRLIAILAKAVPNNQFLRCNLQTMSADSPIEEWTIA